MKKVVFFGLGAVGASMATTLYKLFEREFPSQVEFVFIVRNKEKAIGQLYKSRAVLERSEFIEISDFNTLEKEISRLKVVLGEVEFCINAATPEFNNQIQLVAAALKTNYCDMASDIYEEYCQNNKGFEQQELDQQFKDGEIFGLINAGVSPGITNFLIGEKLNSLMKSGEYSRVKELNLYLLENIESEQIVFSWSPQVALDELEHDPQYLSNGEMVGTDPFTQSTMYEFPHYQGKVRQYPIFQEELISIKQSFPEIRNMRIYTGGNEVELVKNLYQLNLLSDQIVPDITDSLTISDMVRKVLPKMKSPEYIEKYLKEKVIEEAQFAAMAEIVIERENKNEPVLNEIVGLSYHRYTDLLNTEYSGATYISYPTGVGAAILLFHTYKSWLKNRSTISGILGTEKLPALLGESINGEIKREISSFDIDLFSYTHKSEST